MMHESHGLLAGKTVLVTAAAGTGIGFATARRCVEEGARVAISDRHERRLGEAAEALAEIAARAGLAMQAGLSAQAGFSAQAGLSAQVAEQGLSGAGAELGSGGTGAEWKPVAVACDVTSEADVQRMIDVTVEELGHIDVLVNNAGLGGDTALAEMTDEQWFRVLDVTLNGTFRCTRAALRHMLPRGSGVIVNNSSVIGWRAQAGQAHYAAAKAGVMALTRCAAIEAAPHGVRVNAVAPSIAMHEHLAKVSSDELLATLAAREAFGRAAEPWEVADVIVFLASDYSSYMTGEVVSVSSQRA
ncbi:MAG TPA: SDR family oxidoreductase [Streptosporangiaceae bacterium]|nr:SDR family oxidoreductase [Streptosporangiaceae bacterium]